MILFNSKIILIHIVHLYTDSIFCIIEDVYLMLLLCITSCDYTIQRFKVSIESIIYEPTTIGIWNKMFMDRNGTQILLNENFRIEMQQKNSQTFYAGCLWIHLVLWENLNLKNYQNRYNFIQGFKRFKLQSVTKLFLLHTINYFLLECAWLACRVHNDENETFIFQ